MVKRQNRQSRSSRSRSSNSSSSNSRSRSSNSRSRSRSSRSRSSRSSRQMKGGAVEFKEIEINNQGCSTASECASDQMAKQEADAAEQINMKNQLGGGVKIALGTVANSTDEDAALQEKVQKISLQGQANAEFDKNAGTIAGGRRVKRRKSRGRKSRGRKSRGRKSRRRKSRRRKSRRRKSRKTGK